MPRSKCVRRCAWGFRGGKRWRAPYANEVNAASGQVAQAMAAGRPRKRPRLRAVRQAPCPEAAARQSGRASCRERVGQYVLLSVGAVAIKKKKEESREDRGEHNMNIVR